MNVLVIGNGIAGVNVAAGLRSDPSVSVEILGREEHPFYSRIRLPEVLVRGERSRRDRVLQARMVRKKGDTGPDRGCGTVG